MITETATRRRPASLASAVTQSMRAVLSLIVQAWRRRQGRHELDRLDERMLRDIGLSRGVYGYNRIAGPCPSARMRRGGGR